MSREAPNHSPFEGFHFPNVFTFLTLSSPFNVAAAERRRREECAAEVRRRPIVSTSVFISGTVTGKGDISIESVKEVEAAMVPASEAQPEKVEVKNRVDAIWEEMNKGISNKTIKSFPNKPIPAVKRTSQKASSNWMTYLGMAPKNPGFSAQNTQQKVPSALENGTSDEAKRLAAAALSAVKDAAAAASNKGKVEITEVKDFAGQEIEVKKLVDSDSKEACDKAKGVASSGVDAILEQIKKKPKLSVLDKTKKDWGEYKEDNKGLEDELDAYKKSSNQYLDKVSFLKRTDYREFERERDARLALQARRKSDMREDP